jgi:hypothetical protein
MDPRFWSAAERQFVAIFKNSVIPVIFVLTKFDIVIADCFSKRVQASGGTDIEWMPMRTLAIGDATSRVKDNIHRRLEEVLGRGVKSEAISNDSKHMLSRNWKRKLKIF